MKIDIKSRKGALTQQQIVRYLVLIVGFVVLLFFIFVLDLGAITNKEICRNSVILRDKATSIAGELDCRTNYLCVSGGEDCREIIATTKIKVDPEKREEIMKAIAEEMSDCWYMFGEGKINYGLECAGPVCKEPENRVCGLCSIVDFEDISQGESPISYEEFYNYLKTTKKTDSQTYLQYIYSENNLDFLSENYIKNNFKLDKQYFILTAVSKSTSLPFVRYYNPKYQPPIILEKTTENYETIGCSKFVTKA